MRMADIGVEARLRLLPRRLRQRFGQPVKFPYEMRHPQLAQPVRQLLEVAGLGRGGLDRPQPLIDLGDDVDLAADDHRIVDAVGAVVARGHARPELHDAEHRAAG